MSKNITRTLRERALLFFTEPSVEGMDIRLPVFCCSWEVWARASLLGAEAGSLLASLTVSSDLFAVLGAEARECLVSLLQPGARRWTVYDRTCGFAELSCLAEQ